MNRYDVNTSHLAARAAYQYPGINGLEASSGDVTNAIIASMPTSSSLVTILRRDTARARHPDDPALAEPIKRSTIGVDISNSGRALGDGRQLLTRFWQVTGEDVSELSEQTAASVEGDATSNAESDSADVAIDSVFSSPLTGTSLDRLWVSVTNDAADEASLIRLNANAAQAIEKRRRRIIRRSFALRVGGAAIIGFLTSGAFFAHYGNSEMKEVPYEASESVQVDVPYTVPEDVSINAGTLNRLATNYQVPAGTVGADEKALASTFASARKRDLKLSRVIITGLSSEAPVNDGDFYTLPPSGPHASAEQSDLAAEQTVASTRAQDAETAVREAAKAADMSVPAGAVMVEGSEMVPPTKQQIAELDGFAKNGQSVASAVGAFDDNPDLVNPAERKVLTDVLSDNQGFTAKISLLGEKLVTRIKHETKYHLVGSGEIYLTGIKVLSAGIIGLFGGMAGAIWFSSGLDRRAHNVAARRVKHLARNQNS